MLRGGGQTRKVSPQQARPHPTDRQQHQHHQPTPAAATAPPTNSSNSSHHQHHYQHHSTTSTAPAPPTALANFSSTRFSPYQFPLRTRRGEGAFPKDSHYSHFLKKCHNAKGARRVSVVLWIWHSKAGYDGVMRV
jgi:hypothetical protein